MVPVVTALALRLWKRISCWEWREDSGSYWRLWALYGFCLVGSTLVHPMAAVWSAVAILPFLAVEALRDRRRRTAMALVLILIPFVVSGLILMEGRMATISTLEGRVAGPHEGKGVSSFFAPHFPGGGVQGGRTGVLAISERLHIGHPLLVTRYPLAMLGLVLTFVLLEYIRRSSAARYLAVLTFTASSSPSPPASQTSHRPLLRGSGTLSSHLASAMGADNGLRAHPDLAARTLGMAHRHPGSVRNM